MLGKHREGIWSYELEFFASCALKMGFEKDGFVG